MNTFFTTLRQDLLAIRWVYLAWIGATLLLALLPRSFEHTDLSSLIDFIQIFGLISWFALAAITFSRLTLAHSPIDPHNGWRTRPLRPISVAIAKLGVLGLVFLLPVVIGAQTTDKAPPLSACVLILLASLFVAGFVRSAPALLIAGLITAGLVLLSLMLFLSPSAPFFLFPQGISTIGSRNAQLIFGGGLTALILHHYARPNRLRQLLGLTAVLLAVASMSWIYPNPEIPPKLLDRPEMKVTLLNARPVDEADSPIVAYWAEFDQRWSEKFGEVKAHRNWAVRLRVDGPQRDELWVFGGISPNRNLPGIGYRFLPAKTQFLSSDELAERLDLPRGTTFVNSVGPEVDEHFQWRRFHEAAEFPAVPLTAHFQVELRRLSRVRILHRGPLSVGTQSAYFSLNALDLSAGTLEAKVEASSFPFISSPEERWWHYTPTMLVLYNPQTLEAGFPLRDDVFGRRINEVSRYRLPPLSGDPADWQILLFIARIDGRVFIPRDDAN